MDTLYGEQANGQTSFGYTDNTLTNNMSGNGHLVQEPDLNGNHSEQNLINCLDQLNMNPAGGIGLLSHL